jgi:heme/copper-type cytochrome/quinol oxidase subunit 4
MTSILKTVINSNLFFLVMPLILSAFTHLWNPLGFPVGPSYDENIYLRRTMNVLANLGSQESELYDHPYFLQIFLGGILRVIGYPDSLHPTAGDVHSVEMLYLVPKLIMGILSIIDTFLIYKISECYYNKNDNDNKNNNIKIAFIASILFSVMPITSMVRTVWLEPVQLPFLLSSILFATYVKKGSVKEGDCRKNNNRNILILTLLSGIFLGLAIFTKIPAFTFTPLVGYLLFSSLSNINKRSNINNAKFKTIVSWLVPVLSIPSIWPVYALYSGHFGLWIKGIFFQTHRRVQSFLSSIKYDFSIDPVFMAIGFAGFIFTGAIKRDLLILLWVIPFMVFIYVIGFISYWHFIPIFPVLCIAAANMIVDLSNIGIMNKKENKNIQQILLLLVISGIAIFGVLSTTMLISEKTNVNSPYFEAASFVVKYLQDNEKNKKANTDNNNSNKFTVISNPFYSWIPFYVFNLHYDSIDYYDSPVSIKTKKVLLVSDPVLIDRLNHNMVDKAIKKYLYEADKVFTFDDKNPHTNNKVVIYIHQ